MKYFENVAKTDAVFSGVRGGCKTHKERGQEEVSSDAWVVILLNASIHLNLAVLGPTVNRC